MYARWTTSSGFEEFSVFSAPLASGVVGSVTWSASGGLVRASIGDAATGRSIVIQLSDSELRVGEEQNSLLEGPWISVPRNRSKGLVEYKNGIQNGLTLQWTYERFFFVGTSLADGSYVDHTSRFAPEGSLTSTHLAEAIIELSSNPSKSVRLHFEGSNKLPSYYVGDAGAWGMQWDERTLVAVRLCRPPFVFQMSTHSALDGVVIVNNMDTGMAFSISGLGYL